MPREPEIEVYYDGACPLCRREINFYRNRPGAERLCWVDVSEAGDAEVAPGLSRGRALARFHVRTGDGRLVSGGEAFARLWTHLPGFRPLGRLFLVRPLTWILEGAYRVFLPLRPRLQALMRAREAAACAELPEWLVRDLRSDHAGETGAVAIYRGILAVSRDPGVRAFSREHLATEREHLALMDEALPRRFHSLFLPLWRVAGFLTGALPALLGPRAVYATIDAVETFVDRHYAEQIERLDRTGAHPALRATLERSRLDEVAHRDEARDALHAPPGVLLRTWCRLVGSGSAGAVALARRL